MMNIFLQRPVMILFLSCLFSYGQNWNISVSAREIGIAACGWWLSFQFYSVSVTIMYMLSVSRASFSTLARMIMDK